MSRGEGTLLARRYRLLSQIGAGGMGTVWLAHDELLDRDVAVKEVTFPRDLTVDDRQVLYVRTLREARAAARLTHPGIITVHDVVEEDERPWIVMQYVRSRSLQDAIDTGPMPVDRIAGIGRQILSALRAAHSAGVLHRDVKPSNVLLMGDGRAVLTDFGIAVMAGDSTITQTGLVMGSPAYIAPERLRGGAATPAADLWALGATLYAACEGHPPHDGTDPVSVLAAAVTEPVPRPRRAGPLEPAIMALLEPDPARRIPADEAGRRLGRIGKQTTVAPSPRKPLDNTVSTTVVDGVSALATMSHLDTMPAATAKMGDATVPPHEIPAPPPVPDAPPVPPHRRGRLLIALAVAVVVVGTVGTIVALEPHRPSHASTTGPSNAPAARSPVAAALVTRSGPGGSSIGVPRGWRETVLSAVRAKWENPRTLAFIEVDTTPWEIQDPAKHWRIFEQEALTKGNLPDLTPLYKSQDFAWRGWTTADIEYTWRSPDDGPYEAYERGFMANGVQWAFWLAAPRDAWKQADARRTAIFDSFSP